MYHSNKLSNAPTKLAPNFLLNWLEKDLKIPLLSNDYKELEQCIDYKLSNKSALLYYIHPDHILNITQI